MQLRLRPRSANRFSIGKITVKITLAFLILFSAIFLLDKIKVSKPNQLIKQEISNDKLITVK